MLSRVAHKIDGVRKEKERLTAAPQLTIKPAVNIS